jgi:hypothetical protein
MSNELTEKKTNLPAQNFWGDKVDSQAGYEEVDNNDTAIPFLRVLQKMSPQLDKKSSEYISGASDGNVFNTLTKKFYNVDPDDKGQPLVFLPIYHQKQWIEWVLRENGGGLVAIHTTPDVLRGTTKDEKNRDITANGTQIVLTKNLFGFIIEDGKLNPIVIAASSTQLRSFSNIMAQLRQLPGPLFNHCIYIYNKHKTKDADKSWYVWDFEVIQKNSVPLTTAEVLTEEGVEELTEAREKILGFYEVCKSGRVKTDKLEGETGAIGGEDEEIPF